MALLYIWEFSEMVTRDSGIPIGKTPGILMQAPVVIGATSLQSAAFNAGTGYVRLNCDAVCSVVFGSNPTAVAQVSARLAANQTEYFGVNPGDKVAVIATTP